MSGRDEVHRLFERLHALSAEGVREATAAATEMASSGRRVVAVSACLLGERTRHDGAAQYTPEAVLPLLEAPELAVLPLCPEVLGGMGCPRRPVHFASGAGDALAQGLETRVVDDGGRDQTAALDSGARRAAELAVLAGARSAILKERSPSCGVAQIHGPGGVMPGRGAFAARLAALGFQVRSDEDVVKAKP